jgi:hypothetical protein
VSRREANELLDRYRDGVALPPEAVEQALQASGDLEPQLEAVPVVRSRCAGGLA